MLRPIISSAEYPYSASAASFQKRTTPSQVFPMMASLDDRTRAARNGSDASGARWVASKSICATVGAVSLMDVLFVVLGPPQRLRRPFAYAGATSGLVASSRQQKRHVGPNSLSTAEHESGSLRLG